jgi:hypothetical protein
MRRVRWNNNPITGAYVRITFCRFKYATSRCNENDSYPNIQKSFISKRIKNNSWYKGITYKSVEKISEWSNDPKSLRQIKYIGDEAFSFRSDIQIYADSVMLYSTTPPIGSVIIRNEKIADSMCGLFDLMWKFLPE